MIDNSVHEQLRAAGLVNEIISKNSEEFGLDPKEFLFLALNNSGYTSEESKEELLKNISPVDLLEKLKRFDQTI